MQLIKLLIISILFITTSIQAEPTHKIINLHPPAALESLATDINDLGQVVGHYNTEEHPKQFRGFFWDKETGFQDLGEISLSLSINNLGHVVATKKVSKDGWIDFLFQADDQPFIWRAETGIELLEKPLNVPHLVPVSINDHDQILFRNHQTCSKADKVWVWHEGHYQEIKELSSASHLSNNQVITGITAKSLGGNQKLYLPTLHNLLNGTTTLIPFIQEKISGGAVMSNAKGNVFGFFYDYKKEAAQAYFWDPLEGVKALPKTFVPRWMNNKDDIIGFYKSSSLIELHLFDGTHFINIEKEAGIGYSPTVEFLGIHKAVTIKINQYGQIAGTGYLRNSYTKHRAFLIEPVDKKIISNTK